MLTHCTDAAAGACCSRACAPTAAAASSCTRSSRGGRRGRCRAVRVRAFLSVPKSLSLQWVCFCGDSYEAAEDNELSFREGDRITGIEAASDEWWQGTGPDGRVGLFPGECLVVCVVRRTGWADCGLVANYVELQE